MIGDVAAAGAAKISTLQQTFDSMNGLTAKATPTTTDRFVMNDQAASGAARYSTLANVSTAVVNARAATETQMEAGNDGTIVVTPLLAQHHYSAAKCWLYSIFSAGAPATPPTIHYNITSMADTNTGRTVVTIATDFSSATWAALSSNDTTSASGMHPAVNAHAAGTIELRSYSGADPGLSDPDAYNFVGFGIQ
jgi:hypothetical protein